MNPILKGAIAFGTVAGAGGGAYGIYNAMQTTPTVTPEKQKTTTYSDAFQGTLLSTTDDNYQTKWEARLDSLQKLNADKDLVNGLKGLRVKKAGTEQWKELRTWCKDTITNTSKGDQDQEFKNIQSYCTYSIKEKLGNNIIPEGGDSSGKWTASHAKLKTINNLNQTLITARDVQDQTGGEKVKAWCNSIYSAPFKGQTDPDFAIVKQICISA